MVEGETLWAPSREVIERANITSFARWLEETKGTSFPDYAALWRWSTTEVAGFWESIWDYFEVSPTATYRAVLLSPHRGMTPGATRWFEGARLNYAEHIFRNRDDAAVALVTALEAGGGREEREEKGGGGEPSGEGREEHITWGELKAETAALAAFLRDEDVGPGDRVAGYLPNRPEAVVGLLACASIGAVWSCCSPDLGAPSIVDRFRQVQPKIFIGTDGYRYGGRWFDKRGVVESVRNSIPSIRTTLVVSDPRRGGNVQTGTHDWAEVGDGRRMGRGRGRRKRKRRGEALEFADLPFDHPLWILFTSGTTGPPKPIVHGHGGILLEQLKALALHNDVKEGDVMFWYTSAGWMMWNYLVGALLLGSSIVLFDGDPLYPDPSVLWNLAERGGITFFGASAAYYSALAKSGFKFWRYRLDRLRGFGSTGSPLPAAGFDWLSGRKNKREESEEEDEGSVDGRWIASISGGTDVCTAFVGGCPVLPVRSGRIQCRYLGAAVDAFGEDGAPVSAGKMGELVLTEPMPSMPLFIWGDTDGSRYMESYLSFFPGVWRHGDWISIDSDGMCTIYGRSDATIKRRGVRAGTSEIYSVVEAMPEVMDSLVVDLEQTNGESFMPLFVVLREGKRMDEELRQRILQRVREDLSPRFVPDDVVQIDEVPRTLSGKKVEVPIRRILMGTAVEAAVSMDALKNPGSVGFFVDYRAKKGEPQR
jgi:acetoacetyl-CoA synthetase